MKKNKLILSTIAGMMMTTALMMPTINHNAQARTTKIIKSPVKKSIKNNVIKKKATETRKSPPKNIAKAATANKVVYKESPAMQMSLSQVANNSTVTMQSTGCAQSTFDTEFLCLLNNYRAQQGKGLLKYAQDLSTTAIDYADYMNNHKVISHTADGKTFLERCAAHNATCRAENLAWNFNVSAQTLFNAWKASPGHSANMLGSYREIGLGISGAYAASLFR